MKRIIGVFLALALIISAFGGCALSSKNKAAVKEELEHFNEKAIDNIDELLFKSIADTEEWLKSTFTQEEVSYKPYLDEGLNKGYISTSGNILILFTVEDGMTNMYIQPVLEGSKAEWCDEDDIAKVKEMSKYNGASVDGAPKYGVLALYSFDEEPQIRFWYNREGDNSAYLDYVYQNSDFVLTERE